MKRSVLKGGLLLMLCSMLFCACGKQPQEDEEAAGQNVSEMEIHTTAAGDIGLLACGEGGVLYGTDKEQNKIIRFSADDGKTGEILAEGDHIQSLCYRNGKIYYAVLNKLCELDVATKEVKELITFEGDMFSYAKMVAVKDSVFILRKEMYEEEQSTVRFDESDEYQYFGERLEELNLQTGTLRTVPVNNIKCITGKSDTELLIYAYDEIGGFYFSTYQVAEQSFSGKIYRDNTIHDVQDIAYDPVRGIVVFSDLLGIMAMYGDKLTEAVYAYENSGLYSHIQCMDGITYALKQGEEKEIIHFVNANLNMDVQRLKAYSLYPKEGNTSSMDFLIDFVQVTVDELTTKILAGDSDYDFLLLDSQWDLGYHIFRTGAYTPMNDIEGVEELIDSCHEFVGDAAIGEDGTIWMLPYDVNGYVVCYNKSLFEQRRLTQEDIDTVEEVYTLAQKNISEDTAYIGLLVAGIASDMGKKYLVRYGVKEGRANYNTEQYRKILDIRKKYEMGFYDGSINYTTIPQVKSGEKEPEKLRKEISENTLFRIEQINSMKKSGREWFGYDFWHAALMPDVEEGANTKNEVNIHFLVVNPNSEKLPLVKRYVEQLCKALKNDKDSFLLTENRFPEPVFNEVMGILEDSEIHFLYPNEITADANYKYLFEGQSFEDTAEEIERVINMYLNE